MQHETLVASGDNVAEHSKTKPSNGAQASPGAFAGIDNRAPLVVHASKGKTLLCALGFLALAVAMVMVPVVLNPQIRVRSFYDTPTMVVIAQIGGGALFGGLFIHALTILFSANPRVVVSHKGIWVNSWVFGSAIISWAEIQGLLAPGRRWGGLHIVLRDQKLLRARQNQWQALLWLLGGYALLGPQSIPVPDFLLRMSAQELVARIQVRFQPELVQHGIRVLGADLPGPQMPQRLRRPRMR